MADPTTPRNMNNRPGSPKPEQAGQPTEQSQDDFPEVQAQQAQSDSSGERAPRGRKPLFRT
jgi:hypothetical protein